ncbi:MAG: hypothetical protein WD696_22525 [Bryobacteraceae bacterium]
MDWLLHPLVGYGLAVAGWSLCLSLFVGLKRESRRAEERRAKRHAELETSVAELKAHCQALDAARKNLEERPAPAPPPPPFSNALNLTKRSQALQLHRRGDTPEQIAKSLNVPVNEICLLLKVHRLVLSQY